MKLMILSAVLAATAALSVIPAPVKAAYISPDATWEEKAFCTRGC